MNEEDKIVEPQAEKAAEAEPVAEQSPEDAGLSESSETAEPSPEDAELPESSPTAETSPEDADLPESGGETEVQLTENELNELIENLCLSKAEEFRMLGYEHVGGKEVWDCVSDKYRKFGMPPLHQIVNDILSLKSTQFMNWMTMSAFKGGPF
ncbi:hypothetical protein B5M42_005250 [Paenibacillus athensensis]|uniref:Post-transcriptional regulator n=1 Tax=Paenibacillus athensensis TaxID=1967502 RepID=A0A4Y8Q0M1_9BACL|nr:post-transcriptional regulator [Paenibacillus athensensis]MCD1258246.1 hypothetical protein [Paenibacillus athensensis]